MEESAFEHNARQWRQKAVSVSRSCGAGETEAEDIAQDVMLRLWQMRYELDRYRSVEALVVVMTKRMTWGRTVPLSVPRREEQDFRTPQEVLEEKENEEWLERRLAELPTTTVRMAIAVVGILPLLILYPFFQKYFAKGITMGAVKG